MRTMCGWLVGLILISGVSTPALGGETTAGVQAKLQRIIVPRLEVADSSVEEFINLLTVTMREADPEPDVRRKGVNIVLDLDPRDREKKISWRGNRKPIQTILEDVCLKADLACFVREGAVWVSSPA